MNDEQIKSAAEAVIDALDGDPEPLNNALVTLARALGRHNEAGMILSARTLVFPSWRVAEMIHSHRPCPKCGATIDSGGFCMTCEYRAPANVTLYPAPEEQ